MRNALCFKRGIGFFFWAHFLKLHILFLLLSPFSLFTDSIGIGVGNSILLTLVCVAYWKNAYEGLLEDEKGQRN